MAQLLTFKRGVQAAYHSCDITAPLPWPAAALHTSCCKGRPASLLAYLSASSKLPGERGPSSAHGTSPSHQTHQTPRRLAQSRSMVRSCPHSPCFLHVLAQPVKKIMSVKRLVCTGALFKTSRLITPALEHGGLERKVGALNMQFVSCTALGARPGHAVRYRECTPSMSCRQRQAAVLCIEQACQPCRHSPCAQSGQLCCTMRSMAARPATSHGQCAGLPGCLRPCRRLAAASHLPHARPCPSCPTARGKT